MLLHRRRRRIRGDDYDDDETLSDDDEFTDTVSITSRRSSGLSSNLSRRPRRRRSLRSVQSLGRRRSVSSRGSKTSRMSDKEFRQAMIQKHLRDQELLAQKRTPSVLGRDHDDDEEYSRSEYEDVIIPYRDKRAFMGSMAGGGSGDEDITDCEDLLGFSDDDELVLHKNDARPFRRRRKARSAVRGSKNASQETHSDDTNQDFVIQVMIGLFVLILLDLVFKLFKSGNENVLRF